MIQEPISTEETWLQGIPVSPGIALGKIKIQISGSKEPVAYEISPEEVDAELVRFHQALQTTADQIRTLRERMIQRYATSRQGTRTSSQSSRGQIKVSVESSGMALDAEGCKCVRLAAHCHAA